MYGFAAFPCGKPLAFRQVLDFLGGFAARDEASPFQKWRTESRRLSAREAAKPQIKTFPLPLRGLGLRFDFFESTIYVTLVSPQLENILVEHVELSFETANVVFGVNVLLVKASVDHSKRFVHYIKALIHSI